VPRLQPAHRFGFLNLFLSCEGSLNNDLLFPVSGQTIKC
jgi:hypothetical protein